MQILGILVAGCIIAVGFMERESTAISLFDWHAMVIIVGGCLGATIVGSKPQDFLRTFKYLRELLPVLSSYESKTTKMEKERREIEALWLEGKKAAAIQVAEQSEYETSKLLVELCLHHSNQQAIDAKFTNLSQDQLSELQPAAANWDLMGKLGPSFGMVGTLTGMIQLFKNFGAESTNIGAGLSLALLATLYGLTFGAAVAGPIGAYLNRLLDNRLDLLERCEKSALRIVSFHHGA